MDFKNVVPGFHRDSRFTVGHCKAKRTRQPTLPKRKITQTPTATYPRTWHEVGKAGCSDCEPCPEWFGLVPHGARRRNNSLTPARFPCNLKRSEGLRYRISDDLRSTGLDQSNRETFGPFGASIQVTELFSLRTHLF